MDSDFAKAMNRAATNATLAESDRDRRAVMRELYKKVPAGKAWRGSERHLLDLFRKLREAEKLVVFVIAERLAIKRIQERRARKNSGKGAHHV